MTILKTLIPNDYGLNTAREIIDSIEADRYYVTIGNHVANTTVLSRELQDNANDAFYDYHRNLLFGHELTSNDIILAVNNNPWVGNTQYAMYDDQNVELYATPFYCVTNAGSYSHVFKCIDNNSNAYSTVQPDFAEIDATDKVYSTSDGYVWKYMYSIPSATYTKFATQTLLPVVANSDVADNAVKGSIDAYIIESTGVGYDNYFSGTFRSTDLRVNGNTIVYALRGDANTTNTFYTNCCIYVTAGDGIGQYRRVTNSFSNSTSTYVIIETPFSVNPTHGSEYEITPFVYVFGDGNETVTAEARAIVNSVTNSIYKVEVLNVGENYRMASANIYASPVVSIVSEASIRPVLSPPQGHGFDPAAELGANTVIISTSFTNTVSNTVMGGRYSQLGLLRNPLYSNVEITVDSQSGVFTAGETIYGTSTTFTFTITSDDANTSITSNSSLLTKLSNTVFAYFDVDNNSNTATVLSYSGNTLMVTNLSGNFVANSKILGGSSDETANVVSVKRNGEIKGLDSFVQVYKYTGTMQSGTFSENEIVRQGDTWAYVHSANSTVFFLTQRNGSFTMGQTVIGDTSGAVATFSAEALPELVFGTGDVLYIENFDHITRILSQTETFKIVLNF